MSWFAMPQLKEAVIDTSVLIKGVRDQDSYDMFHIIFDSKTYDLISQLQLGRILRQDLRHGHLRQG